MPSLPAPQAPTRAQWSQLSVLRKLGSVPYDQPPPHSQPSTPRSTQPGLSPTLSFRSTSGLPTLRRSGARARWGGPSEAGVNEGRWAPGPADGHGRGAGSSRTGPLHLSSAGACSTCPPWKCMPGTGTGLGGTSLHTSGTGHPLGGCRLWEKSKERVPIRPSNQPSCRGRGRAVRPSRSQKWTWRLAPGDCPSPCMSVTPSPACAPCLPGSMLADLLPWGSDWALNSPAQRNGVQPPPSLALQLAASPAVLRILSISQWPNWYSPGGRVQYRKMKWEELGAEATQGWTPSRGLPP